MKRNLILFFLGVLALPLSGQPKSCYGAKTNGIAIVVFLAADCPISQKYVPVLNDIHRMYHGNGVGLIALMPGNITRREVRQFKQDYDIGFDISADARFDCARSLHASVTPEVFVFDANNLIKYRGAIDNWFYELGGYRQETTENYLIDAIDALLKGKSPPVTNTEAIGCPLNIP